MVDHFLHLSPQQHQKRPPVLIVGGSDGSGTRAVVQVLQQLGVPFIMDDPTTKDVHAQEIYSKQGWPALIQDLFSMTHSPNFEWDDLTLAKRQVILEKMKPFAKSLNRKYRMARDRQKMETPNANTSVLLAFKAPVSMLALPVLTQLLGNVLFLQVVRE